MKTSVPVLPDHLDPALPDEDDAAFVARADRALEASRLANDFVDHEIVMAELRSMLEDARERQAEKRAHTRPEIPHAG